MNSGQSPHVLVMAKAPVPGQVKTRLTPTFSDAEAAAIAHAALFDTLDAVRHSGAARRIVALAGAPRPDEACAGCEVVTQRGTTFNERLAAAWAYAGTPGLQLGMDTPHVTPAAIDAALVQLTEGPDDAVIGLAHDGGWWAIGFRVPAPRAFVGVAMSEDDTGERQVARLRELGLRVGFLPAMRDMDYPADVAAIVADHPHLRVASVAARVAALTNS